ncbi:hypothetical protein B808_138 [Fructilactobacillus florum 8D]|uniref:Helicase Helix-turn-helix domain-containing protein n=1 Tax=Fructilactobacillus florum 8D TaxID=1221538 RepID=W9EFE1_9LACO|nr:helix-turn-helix domain-containing protein [Fructilactobacillus florum]EKK20173.1 hypothetical protein B807_983 [Fructilactobacillus florum 2F]ETO40858.1 hypothetical protein B808_138 [Fructilactobacillus florum 8D]
MSNEITASDALLLELLSDHQPRRPRLLVNLLAGKKTVATRYWGLRYGLLGFAGLQRYWGSLKLDFSGTQGQGLVTTTSKNELKLTKQGIAQQRRLQFLEPWQGWQASFQALDLLHFKQRLLLLIQVMSERAHGNRQYHPLLVAGSDRQFIKTYYTRLVSPLETAQQLKEDLQKMLGSLTTTAATVVAEQLVGFENNGATLTQIAFNHQWTDWEVIQADLFGIAQLAQQALQDTSLTLSPLLQGLQKPIIDPSVATTLQLYQRFHSLKVVQNKRQMRPSTITEHLLLAAIDLPLAKFPYHDFVSDLQIREIQKELGQQLDHWRYEELSDRFRSTCDFWQFRLGAIKLTKEGQKVQNYGSD